jgi:hypothetical protein
VPVQILCLVSIPFFSNTGAKSASGLRRVILLGPRRILILLGLLLGDVGGIAASGGQVGQSARGLT